MHVSLVSYSKASTEFLSKHDLEDADIQDLIAFCARVSNPSNQMNQETSEKLIKYLIKHSHWSPLEMVNACLEIQARLQDTKNRQNSIPTENIELHHQWLDAQEQVAALAKQKYDWAIENGIAKELARKVLPEGLTKSTLYMNGTLRSWIHYIDLRAANGTQQEHMDIAVACAEVIANVFPLAHELFGNERA